jgi:hypothetical protein
MPMMIPMASLGQECEKLMRACKCMAAEVLELLWRDAVVSGRKENGGNKAQLERGGEGRRERGEGRGERGEGWEGREE